MALETTTTTSADYMGYGHGFGYGDSFCSVEKSIGGVESRLIDKLGNYAFDNAKNHSDIAARQAQDSSTNAYNSMKAQADIAADQAAQATQFERDLQNRVHESRMILAKEIGDKASRTEDIINSNALRVADQINGQFTDIKNQLRYMETDSIKQFAALEVAGLKNTATVLEVLSANKYDALKDEVDAIRADRHSDRFGYQFALQGQELNYLKQSIGSVENNQRFGSKTVQFGTGNTSGTAQTANQG